MKIINSLFAALVVFFAANSQALSVSVNASADMTSGLSLATNLFPIGTTVTSDITFDVGPGTIRSSTISNVSGFFNWNDTVYGEQSFSAETASISTIHSAGWFLLNISGLGSTLNGIIADSFSLQFNIGTNPFSFPASTSSLSSLILNSSIDKMRVGARGEGGLTHYGDLQTNVSGQVSVIPLPSSLVLFTTGLFGLFVFMRRKSNT